MRKFLLTVPKDMADEFTWVLARVRCGICTAFNLDTDDSEYAKITGQAERDCDFIDGILKSLGEGGEVLSTHLQKALRFSRKAPAIDFEGYGGRPEVNIQRAFSAEDKIKRHLEIEEQRYKERLIIHANQGAKQ